MIAFSKINIIGIGLSPFFNDGELIFSETWPIEQQFRFTKNDLIENYFPPVHNMYYGIFTNSMNGEIDKDLSKIRTKSGVNSYENNTLISIDFIIVESDNIIKVTSTRKLYTKTGWVVAIIDSLYKKLKV